MAISNEWQFVDNLNKIDIPSTTDTSKKANILDKDSTDNIASVMGWESVCLKNFSNTLNMVDLSYPADDIYVVRPIDENEYPYGILFYGTIWTASSIRYGCGHIIELASGNYITSVDTSYNYSNFRIAFLRPTASGCIGCKMYRSDNNFYRAVFDKFTNVKSGLVKWCMVKNTVLLNLGTGESITCNITSGQNYNVLQPSANFYPYIALKKFTAIATTGIFTAQSLYISYIDYATAERTIEVEGDQYRAIPVTTPPLYIPLA